MKVIVNIPCRNGNADDPAGLGRHPRYIAEGAVWYGMVAREFASMGCDICAMLPMGSPRFQRMSSNLNAMDGPLACAMGLVNHRLREDFGVKVWAYIGWALDRTPEDVGMADWKYPSRLSWADREKISDQIERADRFGWTGLILDAISGQHNHDGKAREWMDFAAERSKCEIGGEAFLRGDAGQSGAEWEKAPWRYDLMHGRLFVAMLEPWIERHGFRSQPGEPWYCWINGHSKTADADWWGAERARELIDRARAAGFERVMIDVDKATPEAVAFVRRFVDAA